MWNHEIVKSVVNSNLEVWRVVSILFRAFRGRFKIYKTAVAPLKNDKKIKINHPTGEIIIKFLIRQPSWIRRHSGFEKKYLELEARD
jgi:hypothetical protein